MCIVTPMAIRINNARMAQCSVTNTAQHISEIHNVEMETILILIGMDLCSMKLEMYVPSFG